MERERERDILFFTLHTFKKQFWTNTKNCKLIIVKKSGSIEEPLKLLSQDAS